MLETAILCIQCPDQAGIVAEVSTWVYQHQGNIICSNQYSTDLTCGRFFMRLEFYFDTTVYPKQQLESDFAAIAVKLNCQWQIHYKSKKLRFAILASKHDHCLFELLYRWRANEIAGEITAIISNHKACEKLANAHQLPFHYFPIANNTKQQQEKQIIELTQKTTDFLVLARYMQILSPEFLSEYNKDIINIHHSFLPSFTGANPYRQAYERGVKIIGATAHYVTEQLDEGPIIEQMVEPISHHDQIKALKRKGKHIEKLTLVNAVIAHCEHRIIRFGNKTIVFE